MERIDHRRSYIRRRASSRRSKLSADTRERTGSADRARQARGYGRQASCCASTIGTFSGRPAESLSAPLQSFECYHRLPGATSAAFGASLEAECPPLAMTIRCIGAVLLALPGGTACPLPRRCNVSPCRAAEPAPTKSTLARGIEHSDSCPSTDPELVQLAAGALRATKVMRGLRRGPRTDRHNPGMPDRPWACVSPSEACWF